MKSESKGAQGLRACEDALQRLIANKPQVPEHVNMPMKKLTAGIVSVEAGFDRGYLKKARKAHLSIIARIQAYREGDAQDHVNKHQKDHVIIKGKLAKVREQLVLAHQQRDMVITQNLQLCERVKELEILLAKIKILHEPNGASLINLGLK